MEDLRLELRFMLEVSCASGWKGENCEVDIDECKENVTLPDGRAACERGQCLNSDGSYTCDCTGTGYTGTAPALFC